MIWYNNIILWYVIYIIQYQCKPNKIQIFLFLHRHDIYNINVNPMKYKYLSNCWHDIYNINANLNWYISPIPRAQRAQRNHKNNTEAPNHWHCTANIDNVTIIIFNYSSSHYTDVSICYTALQSSSSLLHITHHHNTLN